MRFATELTKENRLAVNRIITYIEVVVDTRAQEISSSNP